MKQDTKDIWYSIYSACIFIILGTACGFTIGARSYHPAVMVSYVSQEQDMALCHSQGGQYQDTDGVITCNKIVPVYTHPANQAFLKIIDKTTTHD